MDRSTVYIRTERIVLHRSTVTYISSTDSVQHAWEKARGSVLTVPLERKSILKLVAAARAGSSRVRASAMLPVYSGEVSGVLWLLWRGVC